MRIIAFGDVHMELGNLSTVPGIATADLLIVTGDLTNFGGRAEAEKILDRIMAINPRVLALAGNLDQPEVEDYLTERHLNLHGRGLEMQGLGLFGVGGSNPTPFHTPTEYSERELARLLREGFGQLGPQVETRVLVSHAPPHGTGVDTIAGGTHVGSKAVREFIEEFQPALCLTGHIHEAPGEDSLGATRILNPGLVGEGGWIEIETEPGDLRAILHVDHYRSS